MNAANIPSGVQIAVAEALGLDEDEVTIDATLLGDLGAESIDLLDILFRIERQVGIKIEAGDLADYVQGGIPDDEFGDEDGIITAAGLAQLARVMPQIDPQELADKLEAEQVMGLFTVGNLVELVQSAAAPARPEIVGRSMDMAIGVDVVEVGRVERFLAAHPDNAAGVFTPRELARSAGRTRHSEHLAARFAAKEAVLKAVGTGLGPRMRWTDVEIVNDVHGRPRVVLAGEVAAVAARKGLGDIAVSMTHSAGVAQAIAVTSAAPASRA